MRLHCKNCDKVLTKSLFLTHKTYKTIIKNNYYGNEQHEFHRMVKPGGFNKINIATYAYKQLSDMAWCEDKKHLVAKRTVISVNRESFVIEIPKFEKGLGCCDISNGSLICECGAYLGEINYDCWQIFHAIDLLDKNVYFRNINTKKSKTEEKLSIGIDPLKGYTFKKIIYDDPCC